MVGTGCKKYSRPKRRNLYIEDENYDCLANIVGDGTAKTEKTVTDMRIVLR